MSASAGVPLLSKPQRWLRWLVLLVALALVAVVHLKIGGLLVTQTNFTDKDILGADQKHNLKIALQTRADLKMDFDQGVSEPVKNWFPHRTDGVVNPLWPWIAAWLADADHVISADGEVTDQDRTFFNRGRWFHIGWTLGILLVLGVVASRYFTLGGTLSVVLLTGFGALLPRAAYFQPEPVFFVLFAITWLACMCALQKNSLWMHALIGVFGGLAYLAKGSVEPLLFLYVVISTLRWMWGWVETLRPGQGSTTLWLRRNHWIALFILFFCYFMTAGPRLTYAAKTYGNPFHSYPSYWMWFDDFKDCFAWMDAHNTKAELLAMTPEEKPGFKKYAATHTSEQMIQRLVDGTKVKVMELLWPGKTPDSKVPKPWKGVLELRGVYLGALLGIFLGSCIALFFATGRPDHAAQRVHPETTTQVLFVVGAVVGYSLAYGWYTPIGRGDRFMLSLYAPLVISLVWGAESALRRARRRQASAWLFQAYHAAQWLLVAAMGWRLVEILQFPYFRD
jgi:hypothetical protein